MEQKYISIASTHLSCLNVLQWNEMQLSNAYFKEGIVAKIVVILK